MATGYRGTVNMTSSNGAAVFVPSSHPYDGTDAGAHTFTVTLKTASTTASIIATDSVAPGITGSQAGITVNPAAAATLQVADFPSPVTAGTPGTLTVTARDLFGNTATGYLGTVQITSATDAAAILP